MSATTAITTAAVALDNFDTLSVARMGKGAEAFFNQTQIEVEHTSEPQNYTALSTSLLHGSGSATAIAANVISDHKVENSVDTENSVPALDTTTHTATTTITTTTNNKVSSISLKEEEYTTTTAAGATATTLPTMRHLETSTDAFPIVQTVATTFITGNKNRATTIIVYPTVSPESIVIPIVSCIFGFPILALIVICCLRRRAKLARERDRRRNYDMQDHAVSLVRFSPIHRLNYRSSRAISLRPERSLSQGFTSLELDTVLEERCSDIEQTQTEIINAESPLESISSS